MVAVTEIRLSDTILAGVLVWMITNFAEKIVKKKEVALVCVESYFDVIF